MIPIRARLSTTLLAVSLASLAPGFAASSPRPLAKVGGEPVTAEELKREFVRRHGGHTKFLGGASEVRSFLDKVIDRRLLLQEAYRLGLDELPEVHEATVAFAEKKAVEKLLAEEIAAKCEPTANEIEEAWAQHTTELYQARQIVVATRAEIDEIAGQLAAGADFEELARARSIARTRTQAGLLDSIGWGSMSPEWEAAVFPLAAGETSAPFESRAGWEIVRVLSRRTVEKPDLAKARNRIEGILRQRKLDQRRQEFSRELWTRYHAGESPVTRDPAGLGRLLATAPKTVLATWDGGALDLATFADGIDFEGLARMPTTIAAAHLEDLLRQTVNDFLVRLEVAARRRAEHPDLASEIQSYREELMERVLYADYVLKGIAVSDEEVRAWYDGHRAELQSPERRRVAHIVVATREEAEALRAKILAGESFEELAKSRSSDVQTAKSGGDLGFISANQVPPDFAPVMQLAEAEVSEPIQSQFGWHLLRVDAIEPPRPLPFAEAEADLRKSLLEQKKTQRRAEWVRQLRAATRVTIDERAIAALAKEMGV